MAETHGAVAGDAAGTDVPPVAELTQIDTYEAAFDGWFVVLDPRGELVFAKKFTDRIEFEQAVTSVAMRLGPGTWFGRGRTLDEATENVRSKLPQYVNLSGAPGSQSLSGE